MQLSNSPGKLVLPFAASGNKNSIPVASQIGITPGAASLADGFPPLTMTPVAAGGVPPSGLDMNGILYEMSAIVRWANAGGGYAYDGTFAANSNVGGYPKGARVLRSDGRGYWFNTTDNNTTNPEGAGAVAAGWVPDFTTGVAVVPMASANVTLTPVQYGKPIIVISGLLTTNLNLIFPNIDTQWTVLNLTTGPHSVTAKTNSGVGVKIIRGIVCNIVSRSNETYTNVDTTQFVDVRLFGVSAAGIDDDSAAIQAANDSGAVAIYFPPGEYLASGLTMSVPWVMAEGAKIKFAGITGNPTVTVTGSGLTGVLRLSGNNAAPSSLVNITGDSNTLHVELSDVTATLGSGSNGGLVISGNKNEVTVDGQNFQNSGHVNDSMPQLVTFGGAATGNILPLVNGRNIQSGLITYSSGENSVGELIVGGAVDNGLYNIAGKINIGTLQYHGEDEPVVSSAYCNIGTLIVSKAGNSIIGLSNAVNVKIGKLIFSDNGVVSIAKTRSDNSASGTLWIGEVIGEFTGGGLFGFITGTIAQFYVGKMRTKFIYDAAVASPITSWAKFDALKGFVIGEFEISIVDKNDVLTSDNQFYAKFPTTNLSQMSRVGKFNVRILNSDEITQSVAVFRGSNLAQSLVDVENGNFQVDVGPYLRELQGGIAEGGVFAAAAPAIGTWRKGKRIWNSAPSAAGTPGWVCTTAGATFKAMANLAV